MAAAWTRSVREQFSKQSAPCVALKAAASQSDGHGAPLKSENKTLAPGRVKEETKAETIKSRRNGSRGAITPE